MITLSKLSKQIGTRTLFDDVSCSFLPGHRYALTGPNGCGKSTLLKILMGMEEASAGQVILPKRVGYLRQNIHDFGEFSLKDAVLMGNKRLWDAFQKQQQLYLLDMTDAIGMELAHLEEVIGEEDGYMADAVIAQLLAGMGISEDFHDTKMCEVPSHYQFRTLICQSLFGNPEALLLDEPTNHLDLDSIGWLEEFLKDYEGTLILVSHDRHFLNSVATDIADIDYETVILYPGNYDQMVQTKMAMREKAEHEIKSKQKKIAALQDFVQKFGAGTRSSQATSRKKEILRLQPQELKKSNIIRPFIHFEEPPRAASTIFQVAKLSKSYEENLVFKGLSFSLERGDKMGLIGQNGRGKTTLLKLLAEKLSPSSGVIHRGVNLSIGYFPQNHEDLVDKSEPIPMFEWLRTRVSSAHDQEIRGALGKLLFSGEDAFKDVRKLSGGETARLIFAYLMLSKPNVLLLDEPNGHLDLESVSALGDALSSFSGTVIVASHDRDLIDRVATRILSLEDSGPYLYEGSLEEYLAKRSK